MTSASPDVRRTVKSAWRMESARIVACHARAAAMTRYERERGVLERRAGRATARRVGSARPLFRDE